MKQVKWRESRMGAIEWILVGAFVTLAGLGLTAMGIAAIYEGWLRR